MSHKKAKLARRLARQAAVGKQLDYQRPYDVKFRKVEKKIRGAGVKIVVERPQHMVNPDSFRGLIKKFKEELAR